MNVYNCRGVCFRDDESLTETHSPADESLAETHSPADESCTSTSHNDDNQLPVDNTGGLCLMSHKPLLC